MMLTHSLLVDSLCHKIVTFELAKGRMFKFMKQS